MPRHIDKITAHVRDCDLFTAIGTSGVVYPAAGFVKLAGNAHKIEVNLNETDQSDNFDEHLVGKAGTLFRHWCDEFWDEE